MNTLPSFTLPIRKNDGIFLFGAMQPKPYIFTYTQNDIEVVHGPSCKPDREIYTERCKRDGVPIIKRRGGGGTVVLLPGTVILVIVGIREYGQSALQIFEWIHKGLIQYFVSQGICGVAQDGISDLVLENKKILGSSLYLGNRPSLFYYQSSLLVNSDIRLFNRYLKHPPREPEYRRGRDHGDFCTTLRMQGFSIPPEELVQKIASQFGSFLMSFQTSATG
jgi:lipoate---protein ligase